MNADAGDTTLDELFPGIAGRMQLVRVMLKLNMPQLKEMDRTTVLEPELAARLRTALREVDDG